MQECEQMNNGLSLIFAHSKQQWAFMRKLSSPLSRNLPGGTPITQVGKKTKLNKFYSMFFYYNS
jgi:hypothetical protein